MIHGNAGLRTQWLLKEITHAKKHGLEG